MGNHERLETVDVYSIRIKKKRMLYISLQVSRSRMH